MKINQERIFPVDSLVSCLIKPTISELNQYRLPAQTNWVRFYTRSDSKSNLRNIFYYLIEMFGLLCTSNRKKQ